MKTPTPHRFPWQADGLRRSYLPNGQRICRGAQMGRPSVEDGDPEAVKRLHLRRVPLPDGYDAGGAYWGSDRVCQPLFCAFTADHAFVSYFRARDRREACQLARERHPHAIIPNGR